MATTDYGLTQLGSGNTGLFGANPLFSTSTTDLLSDQGFMEYMGMQGTDVNSLTPQALQDASVQYQSTGNTLNVDSTGVTGTTGLGSTGELGFNTQTLGAVSDVGQLGLGYLNYKDSHARNKQDLEAAKFNLADARKESAATDAYRASYS